MADRVRAELRLLVAARADYLCEYCLIAEEDTFFGCEVDHIISLKHGGATEAGNLAYACMFCNRYKGSDLASLSQQTGSLVRFFNPRIDRWSEHFQFDKLHIKSLTEIGEVTARILRFNDGERILERQALAVIGRHPNARALARIGE
jgi:hypothetical protein